MECLLSNSFIDGPHLVSLLGCWLWSYKSYAARPHHAASDSVASSPFPFSIHPPAAAQGKRRGSDAMSATTAAVPFWRAAGMTYIGYSNICAALVRNCLKEPFKSEAASREKVHFSISKWADGKQEKPSKWSALSFIRCIHVPRPWLDSTRSAWMLCGTVGS